MKMPQIGDMLVCYDRHKHLLFKALVVGSEGRLWTTSVIYAHRIYRYKPLDTWTFTPGDWKTMTSIPPQGNRWSVE